MFWIVYFIFLLLVPIGSRSEYPSMSSSLFWMGVKFAIAALFAFLLAFGLSFDGWFQDISAILGILFVVIAVASFVQAKKEKV